MNSRDLARVLVREGWELIEAEFPSAAEDLFVRHQLGLASTTVLPAITRPTARSQSPLEQLSVWATATGGPA